MKIKPYLWGCIAILTALLVVLPGQSQQNLSSQNTLFQASTISALLAGVYDGDTTFKNLKDYGNFGLGTVNALDGEMIALEGKFYQIKADGVAAPIPDAMKTPFATVTFFQPERSLFLPGRMNYQQVQQSLDKQLPTKNLPYALRIHGTFPYIKVRSVPKQTPPYRRLEDVVKEQSIFEFRNVEGTLVGFCIPQYMQGVNVSGYHFHFITRDRATGGHLLDGQLENIQVEVDTLSDIKIVLPNTPAFNQADLKDGRAAEVNRVEK